MTRGTPTPFPGSGLAPPTWPAGVEAIAQVQQATLSFVLWLREQLPPKYGASGIGKENYSHYRRGPHLVPNEPGKSRADLGSGILGFVAQGHRLPEDPGGTGVGPVQILLHQACQPSRSAREILRQHPACAIFLTLVLDSQHQERGCACQRLTPVLRFCGSAGKVAAASRSRCPIDSVMST